MQFLTDGMLVREMMRDPLLKDYRWGRRERKRRRGGRAGGKEGMGGEGRAVRTEPAVMMYSLSLSLSLSLCSVIMLDEAHERTLHTDIIVGLLRKVRQSGLLWICHTVTNSLMCTRS